MPSTRKFYEENDRMDRYYDVQRRWKTGYRKRTGSDKYVPRPWDDYEDRIILEHRVPDRKLSELLHRSVTAIQIRRCRLKGEKL